MHTNGIKMNTTETKRKTASLRLNTGLFNHLAKMAKRENRSLNNFIETLLFEAINYEIPNDETRAAMTEIETDKSALKRYASAADLFKDMEKD